MDRKLALRIVWMIIFLITQGAFAVVYGPASIPMVELDALLQFKVNYIAKGSQHLLQSWDERNTSGVCESWLGIECNDTASGHHIQGINLGGLGLEGSLAPHLGNLTFLSTLNLSSNAFTGNIPLQLKGCTSLQVLYLLSNKLEGAIPSSLASLPSLQYLNLANNSLSGPIPSALFTNMSTSIVELSLCLNALTGSIPADFGLRLPNLQYLLLWKNNLTGPIPPSLGNCSNLLYLQLYSNQFTASIPAELGRLGNVQSFLVYSNELAGPVPANLGNCTNLIDLELFSNFLTGPIPAELGRLRNLQNLILSMNNHTGAIPPSLGNCTNLIHLELSYNQLTGPIPTRLGFLGKIETLILGANMLAHTIPPTLGNCSSLLSLELSSNLLSGTIPEELGLLRNLQRLLLEQTSFTGIIPSSLGNCSSLVVLGLGGNRLTGGIPASFTMLGQLEGVQLYSNQLSGLLQSVDFSNFTKITDMQLQNNQFGGSLSLAVSFLVQLRILNLGSNQFTGEIPWDSLTNCTFLFGLDLSDNQLSGAIPSILGQFRWLRFLHLQGNLLSGQIPDSADFNNLNLLDINLSFNNLSGSLPSNLAHAFITLEASLSLSHNDFSGSLPPWLGQLTKVEIIDLSNNNFTGGIPKSLGDCAGLTGLVLSKNHLSGSLPPELGNLAYLDTLDISYNNLSGMLPSFLGTRLLQLQSLNVSFNNFSGPIPTDEGVFRHLNASSFQGNPGLCGKVLNKMCINTLSLKQQHHHGLLWLKNWRHSLLIACVSSLMLMGLVSLILLINRRHSLSRRAYPSTRALAVAKRYTAKELLEATQGYSEVNRLGQGGLGVVYKGVLPDGQIVAVKKLKDINKGSDEALRKEMQILGKLRHRNLVQILGCVLNLDIKALVLQYMANGSLEQYLDIHQSQAHSHRSHESEQKEADSLRYWETVSRVALGIAHALAYLHHGYGECIIHGDVKPSNILLDSDLEPHLADFGLAKMMRRGAEAISLTFDFQGSIGYMAPEYAHATRVTTKVDVYSYGVVLLQMLTGKRPTQVAPASISLHEWAKSKLASAEGGDLGSWEELLDAALVPKIPCNNDSPDDGGNQVQLEGVQRLLHMALACTSQHPDDRLTIHQVLATLTTKTRMSHSKYEELS